jgi:hypothetical protein
MLTYADAGDDVADSQKVSIFNIHDGVYCADVIDSLAEGATIYICVLQYICVLILNMCPHTIYVFSYYNILRGRHRQPRRRCYNCTAI